MADKGRGRVADMLTAADEYGPWSAFAVSAGAAAQAGIDQAHRAYLLARLGLARRWQGEEAEAEIMGRVLDLAADVAERARLYEPLRRKHPYAAAIGEAVPAFTLGRGAGAGTLRFNAGREIATEAAPESVRRWFAGLRAY